MMIPGVSGGTMAIILDIYDKLIIAFNKSLKFDKKSIIFLIICIAGALTGMMTISGCILKLIDTFPVIIQYFFIGAVLGGIPVIYKAAQIKEFSANTILYPFIGVLLVLLIELIPQEAFIKNTEKNITVFFIQMFGGILSAFALVLPGISLSQMLLMLGLYEPVIFAINNLNIRPILTLSIGLMLGIILFSKIMEYAMNKYPQLTYLIILGFLFGSIKELFPGIPTETEFLPCIICIILGFFTIYFISK